MKKYLQEYGLLLNIQGLGLSFNSKNTRVLQIQVRCGQLKEIIVKNGCLTA